MKYIKIRYILFKYLISVYSVVGATILGRLLSSQLSGHYLFLFLASVILSSLYGGLGAGVLASVLAGASHGMFFQSAEDGFLRPNERLWEISLFLGLSLLISWFGANMRKARRSAELALKAREEIIAIVSHDLKNPLTTILLNIELIERYRDSGVPADIWDKIHCRLESMKRSADTAISLIHGILDLAKSEASFSEATPVNLAELVNDVSETLKPLAEHKMIHYDLSIHRGDYAYLCEKGRISQALSNLIGNAIKFTPAQGTISIRLEPIKNGFHFSVQDSGPGTSAPDLPHIFDRFWQADKAEASGTGLGLSIVKSAIEKHKGKVWADSIPGKGSTFHVIVPLSGKLHAFTSDSETTFKLPEAS